jgi:hypothetical protein
MSEGPGGCEAGAGAVTSGVLGDGDVGVSFEQAPSASRIKPVCRLRQVLNIRTDAMSELRF